ncbi:MAG: class I SAM-dependent RNA methyltransferase, partial [Candidatus Hydrogenedentes bacterium]|nr:class I SAM-dependent RNA methyltransferase [Candidatus Hydrogenedentota bacterium]
PDAGATRILQFQISPFSFFQTNTLATEHLYGHIRAWVRQVRPRALYDLYGGAGGIAFACSDLVERMWSVESVASATADGLVNARLNDIENVSFHTEKVESYLRECIEGNTWQPEAAVILDPSRAGLHPKALRRLIEVLPEYMLYVSCNPKILAQELSLLLDAYEITQAQGFDLFPHTRHVELVVGLRRR